MAVNSETLQTIFDRIEAGKCLSKKELQILTEAARSQQITIATGDRAVAIGGSADGAMIVTGDRNVVITGADVEAIRELMGTRPRIEKLLSQAVEEEITSRLKQSLHNQALIQLGMEAQPEQVKRPWDSDIKIGIKPPEPIPENWSISQVFDEVQGKLLILGKPGAGKTTTVLELAKELLRQAERSADIPVPVIFNLSGWKNERQSMRNWLIEELKSKYKVRKDIGTSLVDDRRLSILLDGLDELDSSKQRPCVQEINRLLQSELCPQYLVVSSRYEEYKGIIRGKWQEDTSESIEETRLLLNGAIFLRSLRNEQIKDYLIQLQRGDLWTVLQQNSVLLNLVKVPFWLSILVLSEQELHFGKHFSSGATDKLLERLLDAYVFRMLERELQSRTYEGQEVPRPKQTRYWLVFLANQLQKDGETEFLIENLQPFHILSPKLIGNYVANVTTAIGLIRLPTGLLWGFIFVNLLIYVFLNFLSVVFGSNSFSSSPIDTTLAFGFVLVAGAVWSLAIDYNIHVVESLRWDWTEFRKRGLLSSVLGMLLVGPLGAIVLFWNNSLSVAELAVKTSPNQGIWKSGMNALKTLLIATFGAWLLIDFLIGIFGNFSVNNLKEIFIFPFAKFWASLIMFGLPISFSKGGEACVKHFILRLTLYQNGYTPWNYARFLNYATDRLLLQRVGGRYRFIHRLLQEHFAAMPLEK